MKIHRIIIKNDDDLMILIKKGKELISITIDTNNNMEINGYEDSLAALEELSNIQFYLQQAGYDLMNNILDETEKIVADREDEEF